MTPIMRQIITAPQGIVKNGLVAWYDFVQGADAQVLYDRMGNYNGTLGSAVGADTNDPTWTAQGLTFGADDYVNCSAALSFTTGELTMIAAYTPNAGENTADLVYLKDGATRKFVLALYPLAGTKIEVDLLGSRVYGTSSVDALPTIACVSCKLPNTTIICKNGFTETVSNVITPSSFSATNIFIGGPTGIEGYFQGSIHCVLLYNRALSVGELKQNYRFIKKELAKRGVAVG